MEAHPWCRNPADCHKQIQLCTLCRQLGNKKKKIQTPSCLQRPGQLNRVLKEIYQRFKQLPCLPFYSTLYLGQQNPKALQAKKTYFLEQSFIKFPVREQEPPECIGKSTTFPQCAPRAGLVMFNSHGHQISRAVLANSNCSWEWELLVSAQLLWKPSLTYQLATSGSVFRRCVGLDSSTTCIIVYEGFWTQGRTNLLDRTNTIKVCSSKNETKLKVTDCRQLNISGQVTQGQCCGAGDAVPARSEHTPDLWTKAPCECLHIHSRISWEGRKP